MDQPQQPIKKPQIQMDANREKLHGDYANWMRITHNKDEFVLDFASIHDPVGKIVSRIITTPGHLKRILSALQTNVKLYEEKFGEIKESELPGSNQDFGFADRNEGNK